jgi:hypothetical protein
MLSISLECDAYSDFARIYIQLHYLTHVPLLERTFKVMLEVPN